MTFLILLLLNLAFCAAVFFWMRDRLRKLESQDGLRREVAGLVNAFNEAADRDITLLEDLLVRSRKAQEGLDRALVEAERRGIRPSDPVAVPPSPTAVASTPEEALRADEKSPARAQSAADEEGEKADPGTPAAVRVGSPKSRVDAAKKGSGKHGPRAGARARLHARTDEDRGAELDLPFEERDAESAAVRGSAPATRPAFSLGTGESPFAADLDDPGERARLESDFLVRFDAPARPRDPDGLRKALFERENRLLDGMEPLEKVRYLHERGEAAATIAERLGMGLGEVRLMMALGAPTERGPR